MADQEDAVSYFEAMDAVADEVQRDGRVMRALERAGATPIRDAYAALTPHQRARYVRLTSSSNLSSDAQLALARLVGTTQGEAMRDDEAVERARAPTTPRRDRTIGASWRDAVAATMAFGSLPDVRIFVPTRERGAQQVVTVVPGAMVALIGGTGSGKTSLALEIARCHAKWTGPVAVFGLELRIVEAAARLAGQAHLVGWLDAARLAQADLEAALDVDRAYLWERMPLAEIEECIADVQAKHPDETTMVVIDYAQILLDDMTERLAFAAIIERVRLMFQRRGVVGILTSQSSRAGSVALRTGEKLGKATEDTGAESAQLERAAYVTLALGEQGEDDGHGWRPVDLSVGKERMGSGDMVVPLQYHGRSGRFAWNGEAEAASKAVARKVEERERRDRAALEAKAEARVVEFLTTCRDPVPRRVVEDDIGGKRDLTRAAIRRLIDAGHVVEVGTAARKNWHPPVMLASLVPGSNRDAAPRGPTRPRNGPDVGGRSSVKSGPDPRSGEGPLLDDGETAPRPIGPGPLEAEQSEEWEPSAQCKTFAAQRGIDIAPLVAAVHAGPPVRDPDAALMAALVRASMAGVPPDASGGARRGFLGFGRERPGSKR